MELSLDQVLEKIDCLHGDEISYISGRNKIRISEVDRANRRIVLDRAGEMTYTSFERLESVLHELEKGALVDVNDALNSGGNDRSAIEALFAHLPNVGYYKGNSRFNSSPQKKIAWFSEEIHSLGELMDTSEIEHKFSTDTTLSTTPGLLELNLNSLIDKFDAELGAANLAQDTSLIKRFTASLTSKRFCLLTGLAGSGKTKIAEAFARWICHDDSQYKLIAVGADWTNNENLLGYSDAIQSGIYRAPNNGALDLILRAQENSQNPFFLILDEMNLSHVERYFADFLSAMESASGIISLHGESGELKAGDTVVPSTIKLPDNLFIIGTVNIDETTYMFSPKVLDRANVIEFRASADQMAAFLDNPAPVKLDLLTAKGVGFASIFVNRASEEATLVGVVDGENGDIATRLKNDLIEIFSPLADVGAEFGFRTAKEIARFVAIHRELSGETWNYLDALDAQVVQKLMPKLHGSARKLDAVLKSLHKFADEKSLPLTKEKVERMQERLKRDGFTSFAEN